MTSRYTLDRRPVLYGERRLSDPQVRALETAASGPLVYQHGRWSGHADETVMALQNVWLLKHVTGQSTLFVTERGLKVLSDIRGAAQ